MIAQKKKAQYNVQQEASEMKNMDLASADAQNLVKRIQNYITIYSRAGNPTALAVWSVKANIDSYGGEGTAIFVANAIEIYCDDAE